MLDEDGLAGGDDHERRVVEGVEIELELNTGEVGDDAVSADREGAGRRVAVEDSAVLEDLEILGPRVSHRSSDLDVVDRVHIGRG